MAGRQMLTAIPTCILSPERGGREATCQPALAGEGSELQAGSDRQGSKDVTEKVSKPGRNLAET